jgi:hypothetical protein
MIENVCAQNRDFSSVHHAYPPIVVSLANDATNLCQFAPPFLPCLDVTTYIASRGVTCSSTLDAVPTASSPPSAQMDHEEATATGSLQRDLY